MKTGLIAGPAFLILLMMASCSGDPDLEGRWINSAGDLLVVERDNKVFLGKQGRPGGDSGRYFYFRDTVRIITGLQEGEGYRNEFRFLFKEEKLYLNSILLFRDGDFEILTRDALLNRYGRADEGLMFIRME